MNEMSEIQKLYLKNKARRHTKDDDCTCAKCDHQIHDGEWFYRDVMTSKPAHITCRAKKARATCCPGCDGFGTVVTSDVVANLITCPTCQGTGKAATVAETAVTA